MAREVKIELHIGESGQSSFLTNKIKGKLDAVIFKSADPVELIIESENEYIIFHEHALVDIHYLAPRIRVNPLATGSMNLIDQPSHAQFSLNEKLIITVKGQKDTDIELIFRID